LVVVVSALLFAAAACSSANGDASAAARTPSNGCASAAEAASARRGTKRVDLTASTTTYFYLRHVPPSYDGHAPWPLVVDLHGYSDAAATEAKTSEFAAFGDAHHFLTVEPQGSGGVPRWDPGFASTDMRFVADVLDNAEATLCVDTARVYVAGISNGAMMTSAIACAPSTRVAAVADPFLLYRGGLGPGIARLPALNGTGTFGDGEAGSRGLTVPQVMTAWAKRNGCAAKPPTATTVASDVTRFTYSCVPSARTIFYRVNGGGHAWPGSAYSKRLAATVGHTTMSIDATALIWNFFQRQAL
jgi:polyhydroxybutyrate depolymerase